MNEELQEEEFWVYDPLEERSWGPFPLEDEAEDFIASDTYLQSWCLIKPYPKDKIYLPSVYHGVWPLSGEL